MTRRYWFLWTVTVVFIAFLFAPLLVGAQGTVAGDDPPLDQLSNAALWAIISGAAVPWITAFINRSRWDSLTKWSVFFAVALGMSGVSTYINGGIDTTNYVRTALIVVATGTVTYMGWKNAVTSVETKTG